MEPFVDAEALCFNNRPTIRGLHARCAKKDKNKEQQNSLLAARVVLIFVYCSISTRKAECGPGCVDESILFCGSRG